MFRASLKSNCLLIINTSVPQSRRHITKIAASRRETLIGRQSSSSYTALKKGGRVPILGSLAAGKAEKLNISIPTTSTKEANSYSLDRRFLEWFVGFTDGEGNFHIRLTDFKDTNYKYAQFTFQINLHKDEIEVLEYIKNTLKCGHISKSKDKVNYFVNDINSLLYVIIPIFNYVNLNSSKYHHFKLFEKAVLLTENKYHLSTEGKLAIIGYKKEMTGMKNKWIPGSISDRINITKYWLAGFIDAEGRRGQAA